MDFLTKSGFEAVPSRENIFRFRSFISRTWTGVLGLDRIGFNSSSSRMYFTSKQERKTDAMATSHRLLAK